MTSTRRMLPTVRSFPRLYNAKRQIEVSRGLLPEQLTFFRKNPLSETWRTQVSQDVVDFVDKVERDDKGVVVNELLPQEKFRLFQNPAKYFSRPHNVPPESRSPIYFPSFSVVLTRTPHLGPRYAQFRVPLWFSKLDLKSYLKNLYNVDVNHVRSFVVHMKPSRKAPSNRYSRGTKIQPRFRKKMTAELVEPFVWPREPTEAEMNSADHEKKSYWDSSIAGIESVQKDQAEFPSEPDKKHRRSLAEQAKALLSGKATWKPTWHQQPQDVRILQGRGAAGLPLPTSGSSSTLPSPMR